MSHTATSLLAAVPDLADHEARRLLQAAAGTFTAALMGDPPVDADVARRFHQLVARRRAGEPLQYIEGSVQFGPIELVIDARALIPRPETERLWELAMAVVEEQSPTVIVDLCTGSGNLALACKYLHPDAEVIGVDISPAALSLARENAVRLGLGVDFIEGDLLAALPHRLRRRVDLLVSNPPYVAAGEIADLPAEIRDYEPRTALVAGNAGTEVLERIATEAADWLRPGGHLICEIGETQAERCRQLFAAFAPQIAPDPAGRPRYVRGWAPQPRDVH